MEIWVKAHHLHMAQRICDRLVGARLVPLDVEALPAARLALSGILPANA